MGKVSLILFTLTPRSSDSDFERSIVSLKENKSDGVDLNSAFERTKEKSYSFRKIYTNQ